MCFFTRRLDESDDTGNSSKTETSLPSGSTVDLGDGGLGGVVAGLYGSNSGGGGMSRGTGRSGGLGRGGFMGLGGR